MSSLLLRSSKVASMVANLLIQSQMLDPQRNRGRDREKREVDSERQRWRDGEKFMHRTPS